MNYNFLKKLYESLPYAIKAIFSKVIRNKLIKNKKFQEQFHKLNNLKSMSNEAIQKEQLILLKDTLVHAYEHTKYYHKLFDKLVFDPYKISSIEELKTLPVLTRELLQEHLKDLVADDIDGYLVTTGGTSGKPVEVIMSNDAYYIEWAFVYNYWQKFGYNIESSKLATFRGIKLGSKLYEVNPIYNEIRMNVFSLGRNNIGDYVRTIRMFGAEFLYGYPSAIYNFCKLIYEAGINVENEFKAVFLISENLYSFQEEKIRNVLKCSIAMFYGHSERAVFAEKYENGYLFNPLYGVTEISEKGEPIVTGFINRKTPLIRYLVDDQVIENDEKLYEIEGHRNSEVIYGKRGEEFRASSLDFHGTLTAIVSNYQFVQNRPGELVIRVLANDNNSDEKIKRAVLHCKSKLNDDFSVSSEVVKELQYSNGNAARKYKLLIQNIHSGGKAL